MSPNTALAPFSIQQHSKSFATAARLLDKQTAIQARQLYALCRAIDDLVDRSQDHSQAETQLADLQQCLEQQRPHQWLADFRQLPGPPAQQSRYLLRLINAVKTDLQVVRIQDENQLLEYAYGVAGSVGLLMTPLLCAKSQGTDHPQARLAATALGMAMQLSNIARDVVEDAKINRLYLPKTWFFEEPDLQRLAAADPRELRKCIPALVRLLALSEVLYRMAESGMGYIASSNRLAIVMAKNFYRQIGREINRGLLQLRFATRTQVSNWQKLVLTCGAIVEHFRATSIVAISELAIIAPNATQRPSLSTSTPLLLNIQQLIQRDDLTCPTWPQATPSSSWVPGSPA